jgi:hypothetical protein
VTGTRKNGRTILRPSTRTCATEHILHGVVEDHRFVTARGASRTLMALDDKNQFARATGHSDGAAGDT